MKKCIILTLAIAGLALVSCQKEKFIENSEAPANEITLKAATVSTRSAIDGDAFPDGYGMLVSAYRNKQVGDTEGAGDASADYFEGITFTKGTSIWEPSTPKYWPLNGNLDFLCIASAGIAKASNGVAPNPCTWGEGSNVAKKVVATFGTNSEKFDDILYGSANAQTFQDANGTPISFHHAECAVVFLAKSNVAYNSTNNVGITITDITVNGPKTSGVLTVSNPKAGGNSSAAEISASWDFTGVTPTPALKARVWDANGNGVKTDEPALTELNLQTTYSDSGATAATPTLSTKPFGDAYVILPPQDAVSFTISYTLHNGKEADGNTNLNRNYTYKYTPTSEVWGIGKKVVYRINITLNEIKIAPTIIDWDEEFKTVNI